MCQGNTYWTLTTYFLFMSDAEISLVTLVFLKGFKPYKVPLLWKPDMESMLRNTLTTQSGDNAPSVGCSNLERLASKECIVYSAQQSRL